MGVGCLMKKTESNRIPRLPLLGDYLKQIAYLEVWDSFWEPGIWCGSAHSQHVLHLIISILGCMSVL